MERQLDDDHCIDVGPGDDILIARNGPGTGRQAGSLRAAPLIWLGERDQLGSWQPRQQLEVDELHDAPTSDKAEFDGGHARACR